MTVQSRKVDNVEKIAVLRANGIGDFTFALPALEALDAAYPGAEIVLLGKEWHAAFLAGRPGPVDRVEIVPPIAGVSAERDGKGIDEFFSRMAAERFDLALQLHGGGKNSNPFVRRLGARLTAGLRTPDAEPLDLSLPYIYFQSEVMRYLETVSLVGAEPVTLTPRLTVTAGDLAETASLASVHPLVALHPGAGHGGRRWPPEHFATVGDAVAAAGARMVLTGSVEDGPLTAELQRRMTAEALDLAGRLSLNGLLGLFSRCAVVVANDSGPLHLAAAAGTPTVGLYWCFNLITAAPPTRAYHRPHISWRLTCPVCGVDRSSGTCTHTESFVAGIPPEAVTASALELLNQSRLASGP
jgi:ADP-heptose:LPS heptosyltransferase